MNHAIVAVASACALLLAAPAAVAQCTKDADCPGAQVCEGGACTAKPQVAPAAAAPAPQPVLLAPTSPPPAATAVTPAPAQPVVQPLVQPVVAVPAAVPAGSSGRKPLKTTSGTLQLGGHFSLGSGVSVPEKGNLATTGSVSFGPTLGIFVADHLSLQASASFGKGFGDVNPATNPTTFGASFGVVAYPNLGTFGALYVGGLLSASFVVPETSSNVTKRVGISIPFGVLIAFNEHVALDIGLRINGGVTLNDNLTQGYVTTTLGYFGVQAFL